MMEANYRFEEKRLILVIENETEFCNRIHDALSEEYQVVISCGTDEALTYIQQNADRISLILLDIQTVGADGLALLTAIKCDKKLRSIPVIVLTMDKEYEAQCLQIGASDFIHMPCDLPEVVKARVQRAIETTSAVNKNIFDALTGILNQDAFLEQVKEYDALYPDRKMDAICLDICSFHIINDLYGREHGDQILIIIASKLKKFAKRVNGIACRKSADVFLLYVPHSDEYQCLVDKLQSTLSQKNGRNNSVRLKTGIYSDVDKSIDIQSRFDRAKLAHDAILYDYSKVISYYDGEKYQKELINQQLMHDIDTALTRRQFKVYYQPKFDITGARPKPVGAEALVRWRHPEMGLLYPGAFVPVFEENGLIISLDRYVWEETAAQIRKWRDKYGVSFPVSVNVSRIDLVITDLTTIFTLIAQKNGIDPHDFHIEITESAYIENHEKMTEQVIQLHNAGFCIEMDDFGVGYSSLNMLSSIPIDVLKLDKEFVSKMFNSDKDLKMIQLMMQIKESMNIPILAEGVETKEQLDYLKGIGCELVQGYYFSEPVDAERFERFIVEMIAQQNDY